MTDRSLHPATWLVGLALSACVLLLECLLDQWPRPKASDAEPEEFSAERAKSELAQLLLENEPHPVGSAANQRIKQRLLARLAELGLEAQEQPSVGCSKAFAGCAFVENVVATVPGRERSQPLVLMAHYDSVPAGPGAGDDGAGVATLLETARALASEPRLRRELTFLFTDGEEMGLFGAQAFFASQPVAGTVINLEGSGSAGPSQLLRTGIHNSELIKLYHQASAHASSASLAAEVFQHMPNDTDFSVALRAGWTGIDFAFAGERQNYHTPLDTLDRLSLVTLQHHGENLLPLARELASQPPAQPEPGQHVYHSVFHRGFSWPIWLSLPLALGCLACWAWVFAKWFRQGVLVLSGFARGLALCLGAFILAIGINTLAFFAIERLGGALLPWPAHLGPFRLCLLAGTSLALAMIIGLLGRWLEYASSLLAVTLIWIGLALVTSPTLPNAASLFVLPSLLLSASLLVSSVRVTQRLAFVREGVACLCLCVVTPFTLRISYLLEQALGYALIVAALPLLGLYALSALPLWSAQPNFRHSRAYKIWLASSAVVLAAAMALGASLPRFSSDHPQPINLVHVEDADHGRAQWLIDSEQPVPVSLQRHLEPEQPRLPWGPRPSLLVAGASASHPGAPELRLVSSASLADQLKLRFHFRSVRSASHAFVLLPEELTLHRVRVAGTLTGSTTQRWLGASFRGYQVVFVAAVPASGFELELDVDPDSHGEAVVVDWSSKLPTDAARLVSARDAVGAPIHGGDQSWVFTRVRF